MCPQSDVRHGAVSRLPCPIRKRPGPRCSTEAARHVRIVSRPRHAEPRLRPAGRTNGRSGSVRRLAHSSQREHEHKTPVDRRRHWRTRLPAPSCGTTPASDSRHPTPPHRVCRVIARHPAFASTPSTSAGSVTRPCLSRRAYPLATPSGVRKSCNNVSSTRSSSGVGIDYAAAVHRTAGPPLSTAESHYPAVEHVVCPWWVRVTQYG